MVDLTLNVNARNYHVAVSDSGMPLLWVIRDLIGLRGARYGCSMEACDAWTVLIDGQREHSCVYSVASAVGRKIVTVEGSSANPSHPAQQAWVACQAPQCGYCRSGALMAAGGGD